MHPGNAVELPSDNVPARGDVIAQAVDIPSKWMAALRLASRIHGTPFVPKEMRGKPEVVLACILYGDELGIGPMQSLNSIQVIEGRVGASPELMRALVARDGHKLDVVHWDTQRCTLHGERCDTGATADVTWTIEDARTAKLLTSPAWQKYPRAMLIARATSELCRAIFSDCVKGLSYTPDEAAAIGGGAWPADVNPATGEITAPQRVTAAEITAAERRQLAEDLNRPDLDLTIDEQIERASSEEAEPEPVPDPDGADALFIQQARGES